MWRAAGALTPNQAKAKKQQDDALSPDLQMWRAAGALTPN
eukprot:CAMPEP_0118889098 /NCGR_PEP_ID=MMETSP1166-20130328/189_1 /TAXON_ID=1104430 /ORGANISM="Chrysoreinhardia sp, Strain CCMP3193" /LENGTH=39 /DNA_ID= /DNA_START= /DNA_END= /DNA_ORIENTATION=